MSRDVPYDENLKCDGCGNIGAPDVIYRHQSGNVTKYLQTTKAWEPYIRKQAVVDKLDKWLNQCTCDKAYTSRNLRDPNCHRCDFDLDNFIKELEQK